MMELAGGSKATLVKSCALSHHTGGNSLLTQFGPCCTCCTATIMSIRHPCRFLIIPQAYAPGDVHTLMGARTEHAVPVLALLYMRRRSLPKTRSRAAELLVLRVDLTCARSWGP